jgi:hypothetical protein
MGVRGELGADFCSKKNPKSFLVGINFFWRKPKIEFSILVLSVTVSHLTVPRSRRHSPMLSLVEQQEDVLAYTMPPSHRSGGRDVHIYDANDPTAVLGGLILSNGVTNANLYSMVEILVKSTGPFSLRNEGGIEIEKDHHPLQSGKYYIVATGKFLHNHPFMIR